MMAMAEVLAGNLELESFTLCWLTTHPRDAEGSSVKMASLLLPTRGVLLLLRPAIMYSYTLPDCPQRPWWTESSETPSCKHKQQHQQHHKNMLIVCHVCGGLEACHMCEQKSVCVAFNSFSCKRLICSFTMMGFPNCIHFIAMHYPVQ